MEKALLKINKTANTLGLDLSQFVGIPIAAFILFLFFINYQSDVLSFLEMNFLPWYQQISVIFILTIISSIVVYEISGWFLDWIYDLYYPEKRNKTSELNHFIKLARNKWILTNPVYKRKNISIYKSTLEKVEKDDRLEYSKIKSKLAVSKVFRILVIPFILLGVIKLASQDLLFGMLCVLAALWCLRISFKYRAEHSKRLYRWFISS